MAEANQTTRPKFIQPPLKRHVPKIRDENPKIQQAPTVSPVTNFATGEYPTHQRSTEEQGVSGPSRKRRRRRSPTHGAQVSETTCSKRTVTVYRFDGKTCRRRATSDADPPYQAKAALCKSVPKLRIIAQCARAGRQPDTGFPRTKPRSLTT